MSVLIHACTNPITDITNPLIILTFGAITKNPLVSTIYPKEEQLQKLILATFRIATVAGLFFVTIPFDYFLGRKDNLGRNIAFAYQLLIHPYAAALYQASIHGGHPLIINLAYLMFKRQNKFTREDVGGMFLGIAFCVIALPLKDFTNQIDRKYIEWSEQITNWYYPQNQRGHEFQDRFNDIPLAPMRFDNDANDLEESNPVDDPENAVEDDVD